MPHLQSSSLLNLVSVASTVPLPAGIRSSECQHCLLPVPLTHFSSLFHTAPADQLNHEGRMARLVTAAARFSGPMLYYFYTAVTEMPDRAITWRDSVLSSQCWGVYSSMAGRTRQNSAVHSLPNVKQASEGLGGQPQDLPTDRLPSVSHSPQASFPPQCQLEQAQGLQGCGALAYEQGTDGRLRARLRTQSSVSAAPTCSVTVGNGAAAAEDSLAVFQKAKHNLVTQLQGT